MKKTETHEEQVMRVLEEMVRDGEMLKISVNGQPMYGLPGTLEATPKAREVKCKPMTRSYTVKQQNLEAEIKRQKYLARAKKGAITRKLNTLLRSMGAK